MKPYILGLLKNLAHPGTIVGLVISLAIPFLIYLGPNVGHKDTIRTLDLYLPLPLFIVQFVAGIVLFATLNKDFREWIKGILPEKSISIMADGRRQTLEEAKNEIRRCSGTQFDPAIAQIFIDILAILK